MFSANKSQNDISNVDNSSNSFVQHNGNNNISSNKISNKKLYCPLCQHCNSHSESEEYLNVINDANNFFSKLTETIIESKHIKDITPEINFKSLNFVEHVIDVIYIIFNNI